ncbi:dynamin family protein [Clostridium sp.]|uniref:dynamin family protein n=1 Tax=Clostridium sp. TaxID=1506 RepID=UPI002623A0C8|nr:dynamin family protein [Clostridium sp.]
MEDIIDEALRERMILDFQKVNENIHAILDEFFQFRMDKGIREAVGLECVEKIQEFELSIKKRLEDNFSIVIIGDFKRGKSTLVNAFLCEKVVTTNVTPETVTINRISYAEKNSVEAVLENGRRIMLDISELNRGKLDVIISKLPCPIEYIDIKMPIDTLKGIRIIDTPGVGDILNRFDDKIKNYMTYADAVIYVVSALSPLSETEQTFLCASILPQNFSKLFVVLNMMDCLENFEEIEKIKALINGKLTNIFPNSYVYTVSALDEYCRRQKLKRPNPDLNEILEKAFDEMRSTLQKDVVMKKEIIQTERCVNLVKIMIREVEGRITLIDNMLLLSKTKLKDLIDQYENENSILLKGIEKHKEVVKLEIREMYSEAKKWLENFLERLKKEITSAKETPLELLEKHLHFYMIDMIRSAIIECTNVHLKNIAKLLKDASENFANEFSNLALSASSTKIASSMEDISWTNLDGAAVALQFIPGLGALTLLGQAIIGFAKQDNTTEQQEKYINNILSNYAQIKDSIFSELRKVYESIVQFAETELDKIYENQISSSLTAIKQVQDISMREATEKDYITLGLQAAKDIVETAKLKLSKLEDIACNSNI